MQQPFVWGPNGQMMQQSQHAASMQPIVDPMQGWASMGNSFVDALQQRQQASGFPTAPQTFGNLFGLGAMLNNSRGGGLY